MTIPFKVTIPSFQIHFVQQKHDVQMAAVMMQVVPSFYSVYSRKCVHNCANTYEKYLVSKDYYVAQHEDSMCTVPNWKYHILLIAEKDNNDLMQKLDSFSFTYQLVDCLLHYSSIALMERLLPKMDEYLTILNELYDSTNATRRLKECRV